MNWEKVFVAYKADKMLLSELHRALMHSWIKVIKIESQTKDSNKENGKNRRNPNGQWTFENIFNLTAVKGKQIKVMVSLFHIYNGEV